MQQPGVKEQTGQVIDLRSLSNEQIEKELERRKVEEKESKRRQREKYESDRNILVSRLVRDAKNMEEVMSGFKQKCLNDLNGFRDYANFYGDIKKSSLGGFSLRNSNTQEVVSLDRNRVPEYDERASMAESLLKEFLEDKIKRRDLQTFRTISALLEKNKKGDFTPARISSLLKIKDNYDDERWQKAMQLFEESFSVRDISYSVSFYTKDAMGKDQAVCLTFASIPVDANKESGEQDA